MALDRRLRDQLIRQVSDPNMRAILGATALVESGGRLNAVGDQGQSFGPFQENIHGRGAGLTPAQSENAAGAVARALKEFSVFKGRGYSGAQLAAASQRPADRAGYIQKINAALGQARAQLGGASPTPPMPSAGAGPVTNAPALSASDITSLISQLPPVNDGTQVPEALSKTMGLGSRPLELTSQARQTQIDALLASLSPTAAAASPRPRGGRAPSSAAAPPPSGPGVLLGHPLDRKGMTTQPGILNFARRVAGVYGQPITLGTGTAHNQFVAGEPGVQSNHWLGTALDLPASGSTLTAMGQAALIAAGMPPAQARKQTGGVFNVGGYNILFNTQVGGNHFNHLHVGMH